MSVVGIDFGTSSAVIASVQRGGIDIVQNQVSSRQTSAIVGFGEKKRELGEDGKTQAVRNIRNTIYYPKLLLGRSLEQVEADLPLMSAAKFVSMPDGSIGAEVSLRYNRETVAAEQITASFFTDLRNTTEKATGVKLAHVCVTVPGSWTSRQRQAILDAGKIAGLNIIGLVNDVSAAAINWGFYRVDLSEATKVLFVQMGSHNFSASLVEFTPGKATVLARHTDSTLGAFKIDVAIAERFAQEFNAKYKVNLRENTKSWFRLLTSVDKVKKTLNENEQTGLGIECLLDDYDLRATLKRDEYEEILQSLNIVRGSIDIIQKVLDDAGVAKEQVNDIEWLGSGLRVVKLRESIREFFGKERLSNTMNAEEGSAKGAALYCAFNSPLFKVRDYALIERLENPVRIYWKTLDDPEDTKENSALVFKKGNLLGKTKNITYTRPNSKPFEFWLKYDEATLGEPEGLIGHWKVTDIPKVENGKADVRLKIKLTKNGIVTVTAAELVEEKEVTVEVPVVEDKMEVDTGKDTPAASPPADASAGAPAADDPMEAEPTSEAAAEEGPKAEEPQAEEPPKPRTRQEVQKKTVCTPVKVTPIRKWGLSEAKLKEYADFEIAQQKKDIEAVDAANAKNELETFVYSTRNNIYGAWNDFATDDEKSALSSTCQTTEDWIYDEGEDVATPVYKAKLADLKKLTDPVDLRAREWDFGRVALDNLLNTIEKLRAEALSAKEEYAHIPSEELNKIPSECNRILGLLQEGGKLDAFKARKKTDNPVFKAEDLNMRAANLSAMASKIFATPKPTPPPEPKPEEKTEGEGEKMEVDSGAVPTPEQPAEPAAAEPMETDE